MKRQNSLRRHNSAHFAELAQLIQAFKNFNINEVSRNAGLDTTTSERRRLEQLRQRSSADREWVPVLSRIRRRQSQRQVDSEPRTEEDLMEGERDNHPLNQIASLPFGFFLIGQKMGFSNYQSSPVVLGGREELMADDNPMEDKEVEVVEEVEECPSEEGMEETE